MPHFHNIVVYQNIATTSSVYSTKYVPLSPHGQEQAE